MEFFKTKTAFDFIQQARVVRWLAVILSGIAILGLLKPGLNWGLEFTGGTLVEVRFSEPVQTQEIQSVLQAHQIERAQVKYYGSSQDILIRFANQSSEFTQEFKKWFVLDPSLVSKKPDIRRTELIGSEVGAKLAEQGSIAGVLSILAMMLYLAVRFEPRSAVASSIALCHDGLLVLGILAFVRIEFDLAALAAVLAVLGYSLNDKVVVFDRVRENSRRMRSGTMSDLVNDSINQTLSRTIMTSFMTLLVVIPLLWFGGEALFGFSLVLFLGILIGTYSSIYIAGYLAVRMGLKREDLLPQISPENHRQAHGRV